MDRPCHEADRERNRILLPGRPTESRPSSHTHSACQESRQIERRVGDYGINDELQLSCRCIARVVHKTKCSTDPNGNTDDVYLQVVTGCCDEHRGSIRVSWSGDAVRS